MFQDAPHDTAIPLRASGPGPFLRALQAATDFPNAEPLLTDPEKDLPHPAGFVLENVIAGTASALGFAHLPIAIGRATKSIHIADLGSMTFAAATALQNLGSRILSDHPLDL